MVQADSTLRRHVSLSLQKHSRQFIPDLAPAPRSHHAYRRNGHCLDELCNKSSLVDGIQLYSLVTELKVEADGILPWRSALPVNHGR